MKTKSAKRQRMKARCAVCRRSEGNTTRGRFNGCNAFPEVPLGPIKRCAHCKRLACPDCLHERDCCPENVET